MAEEQNTTQTLMQQAHMIARRVQIKNIWLARSDFVRQLVDDSKIPKSIELKSGFKIDHDYDREANDINVIVSFLAAGGPAEASSSDDDVFRVEAGFSIQYHVEGDEVCEDAHLDAFSRMNGIYNAWPYWREYLQSTVLRMGLPPVVLPVLSAKAIEKMVQSDKKTKTDEEPESPQPIPHE